MNFEIKAYKSPQGLVLLQYEAANAGEAQRRAEAEGFRVVSIKSKSFTISFSQRSRFPLVLFTQELLALIEAGLPLLESIETLAHKERNPLAKELYVGLMRMLREGRPLSKAMMEYPGSFPSLYVETIRASEYTGDLQQALARYLAYQQQIDVVRKKVASAAIYPVLLMAVGGLVVVFLMVYVVPRFSKVYEDMGGDLPLLSRLLLEWGHFFEAYTGAIVLGMLALAFLIFKALTRPLTRDWLQRKVWDIPSIGERLRVYQLARLYRTLGMLLTGGIPLVTAMDMVQGLLTQPSMRANLRNARQQISEGQSMSEVMEKGGLTTEVAYRMLRVGERSGNLGEMTERIAKFYDEETARWVEWFTKLFEPILMIFIGFVIGGIVLLMYLPVFELAGSIQ
jgi:general secretion pathway protein F